MIPLLSTFLEHCSIDGCSNPHYARTFCNLHYKRWREKGDPGANAPKSLRGYRSDPMQRLLAHRDIRPGPLHTPCWISTYRPCGVAGYTKLEVGDHYEYAHRFAYESFIGPIPPGLQIDHLCRVRTCFNPEHLEAVTSEENTRRGNRWP